MSRPAERLTNHETKAARLLVLHKLQEAGLLSDISDAALARALHTRRETVWKDRQVLARIEELAAHLIATTPWAEPPGYTVTEAAALISCDPETLRYMLRDGLIQAEKTPSGRWRISEAELARLRKKELPDE